MATAPEVASSAGAGEITGSAGASPTLDVRRLTDREILDLETPAPPDGGKPAEPVHREHSPREEAEPGRQNDGQQEEPGVGEQEEPAAPEATKAAESIPQDGRQIPPKYREILKANPELRDAWFRDRAYQEVFPTVAEARAVHELLPGGVEDLKQVLTENKTVSDLDQLYFSGTPEGRGQLVDTLLRDDPKAFSSMVPIAIEKWAQADPEAYDHTFGAIIGQTFSSVQLPEFLAAIREQLKAGNTTAAEERLRQVEGWVNGFLSSDSGNGRRPDPREWALERGQRELAEREARFQAEQQDRFDREFTGAASQKYLAEVQAFVKPKLPAEITDKARNRIVGDIVNEINRVLGQSRAFVSELARVKSSQDTSRAVNFVVARARQLLPQVTTKVLSEWTGEILAANRKTINDKRNASSRVDIGAGGTPGAGGPRRPLRPGDLDYGRMSDRDILNL